MAAPAQVMLRNEVAQEVLHRPDPNRIRTVVVDDSPTFLQVTCEMLELDPMIDLVARAGKGGEAIEMVLKTKPDMVLMDVNMPYLDGLTLRGFSRTGSRQRGSCLCPRMSLPSCGKPVKMRAHSILFTKKIFGRNLVR
jgi:PleD family two-component response regulator